MRTNYTLALHITRFLRFKNKLVYILLDAKTANLDVSKAN